MRLALICDWYAPRRGGIETHLQGLASRLPASGHEVHVITSTPGDAEAPGGVIVHRLSARRLPRADVVVEPGFVSEIAAILRGARIQLVHAHVSIVSPVAVGGVIAAEREGIPSVVTFHSFVPATPLWSRLVGGALRANRWNAVMTAVSRRVLREVAGFAPGKTFTVLPNAIDLEFWSPAHAAPVRPCLSLAYVGRLQPKKAPMRALKAVRMLRRSSPDLRFRLAICGSGPMERRMRHFVTRQGLADVVDFLGWKDPTALRDLLRGTDIFLSPADRESFGIAALEARAVGVPVIAMKGSAVSDFVVHRESGLLASSDEDFADAVFDLAHDTTILTSIRDHNRRVRPGEGWQASLRAHAEIYQRALSGPCGP